MRSIHRCVALLVLGMLVPGHARPAELIVNGPPGSVAFGFEVATLSNGNIVVVDFMATNPGPPAVMQAGAVYLYRPGGTLISVLRGAAANNQVGRAGIRVLGNGDFVVLSGAAEGLPGALTIVSGTRGLDGTVSAQNSLLNTGTSMATTLGVRSTELLTELPGGRLLVHMPLWGDAGVPLKGAILVMSLAAPTTGTSCRCRATST